MARPSEQEIEAAFAPFLDRNEKLEHVAFGVKQPNFALMAGLICFGILPGMIAVMLLTKNYWVGLTNRRLLVLRVASPTNLKVKEVIEYSLDSLRQTDVRSSTGILFTHIRLRDARQPFVAKFHRAYSRENRRQAMAIAEAIHFQAA